MNTEQYLPKDTVVKCDTAEQAIEVAEFWVQKLSITGLDKQWVKDFFVYGWGCVGIANSEIQWNQDNIPTPKSIIHYTDYKAQYMTDFKEAPTEAPSTEPTDDFNPIEPHYYKTDLTDFIEQHGLNFQRGNALKYIVRAGKKNSDKEIEDLQKALWYIQKEIQFVKSRNQNS